MKNTEKHIEPKLKVEGFSESDLKRNAFKTPEGYFQDLTPRVMEAVRASEINEHTPSINWWRVLAPSFGFAAMLFSFWFLSGSDGNDKLNFDQVVASMTLEELDQFADFETEELLAYGLVSSEGLKVESDITEQDLIDYLLNEEEMELTTIYEELDI